MKRIRVVFIDQESQMGGVEVTTLMTASRLDAHKFAAEVVCPAPGDLVSQLEYANVPVTIIKRPRFYSVTARVGSLLVPNPFAIVATGFITWISSNRLVSFLRAHADVVVTKGLLAHIYGGFAARRAGVPCIWHVQEVANGTSMGGLYLRLLNSLARRWPKAIVVDAAAVGAQFEEDLHKRKLIHLLYNGVDLSRFSPLGATAELAIHANGNGQPLIIGHLGRIVPLKGQHLLIEALAKLIARRRNVHLVLAGTPMFDTDHYLLKLKRMVSSYHLDDRVHFLGFRHDSPSVLRAFDIFAHPSVEPDSPVGILEAMAAGKPVVAGKVPGTAELLEDGVDGYLVAPGDIGALVERLTLLLDQPGERQRLGEAARSTAEMRFDQKAFVRSFEDVLNDVIDEGHAVADASVSCRAV